MGMWLNLECSAGTSIETASADACRIAETLGLSVEFDFNGVRCIASPGGDPELLAQNQQAEQARKVKGPLDLKFASANHRLPARLQESEVRS